MSKIDNKGAILYAASRGDTQEVLRLLSTGVDINEQDYDKRTALHVAAANGHLGVLETLCNKGADLSLTDRWGRTALADAMSGNHYDAINFLRQRTNIARGAVMLKQISFNHVDPQSPLSRLLSACAEGKIDVIRSIMDAKQVDVNSHDDDRRTPAHLAASEGRLDVLQFLANQGANLNAKDRMGNRPLNDATRGGFTQCVEFLLSKGAVLSGANSNANNSNNSPIGGPISTSNSPNGEPTPLLTLRYVSKEALTELHERGVREFWSWDESDIEMEKTSFAKGAGGEVFKCQFRNMECVAKTLGKLQSKQNLTDLSNEISLMASIRHPYIVTFFGACFQTSEPVMLLEYCAGGNLESRIIRAYAQDPSRRIKMTDSQKLKYSHQIALAMTFLHRFHIPIIHRDLKPGNVLLTANDDVKITDFGLAKFLPRENPPPGSPALLSKSPSGLLTNGDAYKMTGETGSYRFMAPEVYEHKPYDRSVDIYAYAMILYWLYTGIRPFYECRDGEDAVKQACKGIRPDSKELKEGQICDICESGWAAMPEKRPTFAEIADQLESCKSTGFTRTRGRSRIASRSRGRSISGVGVDQTTTSGGGGGGTEAKEEERSTKRTTTMTTTTAKLASGDKSTSSSKPMEKRKSMFTQFLATIGGSAS